MNDKLRYKISKWEQSPKCLSNLSEKYKIHVSTVEYSPNIKGRVIQVHHENIGVVFAIMVDVEGTDVDSTVNYYKMSTDEILNNLSTFGFNIEFKPEANLVAAQQDYLIEISKLSMDKIRIMKVYERDDSNNKVYRTKLVAFSSAVMTNWLLNTYTCSKKEFDETCGNGYAINLSTQEFDWSWLTYVANIEDIIKMN